MEIRELEATDREAIERFVERVPEGDRTFFKENVEPPGVMEAWTLPGTARAGAVENGEVVGYMAVAPLHGGRATSARSGWSSIPTAAAAGSAERSRGAP
jgi:hypothetical protein